MLSVNFFFSVQCYQHRKISGVWCGVYIPPYTPKGILDQPKNHLLEELAIQHKNNGPCFITQTSPKESKQHFYRRYLNILNYNFFSAIEESNNKNLEFFILKKEYNYQLMRHCFDGGRFSDGTYPGNFFNIFKTILLK